MRITEELGYPIWRLGSGFLLNFYSFQRINGALLIFLGVNRENVFAICMFVA